MEVQFPIGTRVKWTESIRDGQQSYFDRDETGVVIGYAPIIQYINIYSQQKTKIIEPNETDKFTKVQGGGSRKKSLKKTQKNRNRFLA